MDFSEHKSSATNDKPAALRGQSGYSKLCFPESFIAQITYQAQPNTHLHYEESVSPLGYGRLKALLPKEGFHTAGYKAGHNSYLNYSFARILSHDSFPHRANKSHTSGCKMSSTQGSRKQSFQMVSQTITW